MDSDQERQVLSFAAGLALGAVIGAGVALLTTPHHGRKTRTRRRRVAGRLRGSPSDRFDDLASDLKSRIGDTIRVARRAS